MLSNQQLFARVVTILILAVLLTPLESSRSAETPDEAIESARKARAEGYSRAYLTMGQESFQRGEYLRATRVLSEAIKKGDQDEAYKLRGQAFLAMGEYQKAISDFDRYVSRNPDRSDGHVLRGDAYNFRDNHIAAVEDYSRAIDIDPSLQEAYLGRGVAFMGLEQYNAAVRDLQMVLKARPNDRDALHNIGIAYMLANQPLEAKGFLEKAMELETDTEWQAYLNARISKLEHQIELSGLRGVHPSQLGVGHQPDKSGQQGQASAKPTSSVGSDDPGYSADEMKVPLESVERKKPLSSHARAKTDPDSLESQPESIVGDWDTTFMGTRIQLSVLKQIGKSISGRLRITDRMGKQDTYHFQGTFDRGNIQASHHEGHAFKGSLTLGNRLTGVLRMRDGRQIPINLSK